MCCGLVITTAHCLCIKQQRHCVYQMQRPQSCTDKPLLFSNKHVLITLEASISTFYLQQPISIAYWWALMCTDVAVTLTTGSQADGTQQQRTYCSATTPAATVTIWTFQETLSLHHWTSAAPLRTLRSSGPIIIATTIMATTATVLLLVVAVVLCVAAVQLVSVERWGNTVLHAIM
jgi:hypothetical protein